MNKLQNICTKLFHKKPRIKDGDRTVKIANKQKLGKYIMDVTARYNKGTIVSYDRPAHLDFQYSGYNQFYLIGFAYKYRN